MASVLSVDTVTSLVSSLHSLNELMQRITVSLSAKQAITSDVLIRIEVTAKHNVEVRTLRARLFHEVIPIQQQLTASWIAEHQPAAEILHSSLRACATSFEAYISAAPAALQQLNAVIFSPQHVKSEDTLLRLFMVNKIILSGLCECLTFMITLLSTEVPSACTSLQPVLNRFLAWLLSFIRGNSPTLQAVLARAGVQEWLYASYASLHLATVMIHSSTHPHKAHPTELCNVISSLPAGFLATLCCLACELQPLAPKAPPKLPNPTQEKCITRYTFIMFTLQEVLWYSMIAHQQADDAVPRNPDLVCPASIEAVKRAVAFFHITPGSREEYMLAAQATLSCLLTDSFSLNPQESEPYKDRFFPQASSCSGGPVSNRSSSTSKVSHSYCADLTPRHLTSDQDLLLLLLQSAQRSPQYLFSRSTAVMGDIMRSWQVHDNAPVVLCLAYILRHCSHHMRRVMQQQRKPSEQWRTPTSSPPLPAAEHFQLQMMMLVTLNGFVETLHMCADAASAISVATQQQQQQHMSSPECKTIIGWQKLPGSSAVLEMVLREQEHQPAYSMHNVTIRAALISMVVQLKDHLTPCSIRSHISLIVSVHKILRLQLCSSRRVAPDPGGLLEEPLCCTDIAEPLTYLSSALSAVLATDPVHKRLSSNGTVVSELSSASETHKVAAIVGKAAMTSTRLGQRIYDGSTGSAGGGDNSVGVHVDATIKDGMQQLRAVIVTVLVWLANPLLRIMQREYKALNWASEEELGVGWLTGLQAHDAELAGFARQLLLPLCQPEAWETPAAALKREAVVWDAYALRHFHGRLLPGCSHFGCTNTSGISEASLDTLLCSGCKRTRYCSVACQQAAWVDGGHSGVCGKGGWALSHVNI